MPLSSLRTRIAAAALLLAVGTGCASIRRGPVADHIVSARQLVLRGSDAMQRSKWEEAEYLFAEAIDMSPYEERAHAMYAETLWRRGERELAVQHLEESVRLSGGDAKRLVRLGEFYLQLGELNKAGSAASHAIRRDPNLAGAYALQGNVLSAHGQFHDALERYHQALNIQETYPLVQMSIASIYQRQSRPRRALATLAVMEEGLSPEQAPYDLFYLRALAETSLGRHHAAAQAFRRCVELRPNNPDALVRLAESNQAAGDVSAARLAVAEALLLAPQHQAARQLNDELKIGATRTPMPRY